MAEGEKIPVTCSGGTDPGAIVKPSRATLVDAWLTTNGAQPPKGLSTRLLALSAAYNAQVRAHGSLKSATRKRLMATAQIKGAARIEISPPNQCRPAPGTRLIREWRGRSHMVDVHEGHVIYEGRSYKSLSAVARTITGARWSGPRFFGVS